MFSKGNKINDRYEIIKSIGEGGMANVYLAHDIILDRDVAIKVLRGDLAGDDKFVRRFQREALSATSLTHPNIVEVYDVGDDNGQYYIVMEYVEGKNLKDLIKKRGKLTLSEVIDIMLQITDGMSVAHDSYIIHRDIKPQNIMILENGLVKIMDFGIAMAMNSTQLTQTNSVMGSVHYLPPEQASGKGASLQSDIYSMGILMYELLSGKLPYKGDNAVEIALKHLKEPLPSIRDEVPNIPQSVENIIIKATAKNPKNRYTDAREMNQDLSTCLDESRVNEERIVLPYREFGKDEAKVQPKHEEKKREVKEVKRKETKSVSSSKKEDNEELFATQITKNDMKKQNKTVMVLLSIFALLVVAITTVIVIIPALTTNKVLKVPDVTGYSVEDAVDTLQKAGFKVSSDQLQIESADIPLGKVAKTNPGANHDIKKGTEIKLFVSKGNSSLTLENYKGKNYYEIKGMLEALGMSVLVEKQNVTEDVDENEIIDQSPAAGQIVTKGSQITLYVPNVDKYPDFANGTYKYDDVVEFCKKYDVTVIKEEEESSKTPGTVLAQSRPKDTPIVKGTSITVKVAKKSSSGGSSNDNSKNDLCTGDLC